MSRFALGRPSLLSFLWIGGCATFLEDGFQTATSVRPPPASSSASMGQSGASGAGTGGRGGQTTGTGSLPTGVDAGVLGGRGGDVFPSAGAAGEPGMSSGGSGEEDTDAGVGGNPGTIGPSPSLGVVAYGTSDGVQALSWSRDGAGQPRTLPLEGRVTWVRALLEPTDPGSALIGVQHHDESSGTIEVLRWSSAGLEASETMTFMLPTDGDAFQSFDMAFEKGSRQALLVYARGEDVPYYRVRAADGRWGPETALPEGPSSTGVVRWVRLIPSPIDDRMIAMYSTDDREMFLVPWNGDDWVTDDRVGTNLHTTGAVGRAFDGTFTSDGNFVALWAPDRDLDATMIYSVGSQWSDPTTLDPWIDGTVSLVRTLAHPEDARGAALMVDATGSDSHVAGGHFNGQWTNSLFEDSNVIAGDASQPSAYLSALAWVGDEALALWPSDDEGQVGSCRLEDDQWSDVEFISGVSGELASSIQAAGSADVGVALVSASSSAGATLVATTYSSDDRTWSEPMTLTLQLSSPETTPFDVALPWSLD